MKCRVCGGEYSKEDLRELREMGEPFYYSADGLLCPDCYDRWSRLPPEEQLSILLGKN